jgi:hypothetical protein
VVDSVIVPRSIPEDVAQDRLDNIRDSDFLYKILKSKDIGVRSEDIGFKGGVLSTFKQAHNFLRKSRILKFL